MEPIKIEGGMTVYDVNKAVILQMPSKITSAELEPCKKLLRSFKKLGYFMLMCREENWYTVLKVRKTKNNPDKFEDLVIELLQKQGEIKGLNLDEEKKAIECWIYDKEKNEVFMYLLFPYSWGVIECSIS